MKDSNLLDKATKWLDIADYKSDVHASQTYSLQSIAASLLVIARNMQPVEITSDTKPLTADDVELIVRRLLDQAKGEREVA